ncbi:MAG: branched-chain amino acid ABC transporter permease [Desulfurococcales archaeon]|nr:branched-chain amino acid ABC transporter permease [Desulfurococcales archaeon]
MVVEGALLQALVTGVLLGGVYALMTSGLSLIFGVMDIANAAQATFAVLAAYLTYWLQTIYGVSPFVGMVVSALALFVVGVVVYKFMVSRVAGLMAFTLLYMMAMFLENTMIFTWTNLYRNIRVEFLTTSIGVGGIYVPLDRLVGFAIAAVGFGLLSYFLKYTYLGKAIRATMQNPVAASLMGINVKFIYLITFGLGLALSGFAGTVMGVIYSFNPTIADEWIGIMFAIVVFGGLGSLMGTFIASLIIGVITSIVGTYVSMVWSPLVAFAVLILTLWIKPSGIMGRKL